MQSDANQIYKLTASRTGKNEEVYKDIGQLVFASLQDNLRKPKTLIIKLKGVGSWYLRKHRLEKRVNNFGCEKGKRWFDEGDMVEIEKIFKERLKEYDEYIRIRTEVQTERRKTQTLIKPKDADS